MLKYIINGACFAVMVNFANCSIRDYKFWILLFMVIIIQENGSPEKDK